MRKLVYLAYGVLRIGVHLPKKSNRFKAIVEPGHRRKRCAVNANLNWKCFAKALSPIYRRERLPMEILTITSRLRLEANRFRSKLSESDINEQRINLYNRRKVPLKIISIILQSGAPPFSCNELCELCFYVPDNLELILCHFLYLPSNIRSSVATYED